MTSLAWRRRSQSSSNDAMERAEAQSAHRQTSLWKELTNSGIGHLLAARFLQVLSVLVCYPFLPSLTTDLFASRAAGQRLRCGDYPPGVVPSQCVEAHASVVAASASASLVSNCVVALFLTPLMGTASDLHGRKPYILMGFAASMPPFAAFLVVNAGLAPITLPYILSAFFDGVSSFSVSQAYVADVVAPANRAWAFALMTAVISSSLFLGPALAGLVPDAQAALWVCLIGLGLTTTWVAAFLPESLSKEARAAEALRRLDEAAISAASTEESYTRCRCFALPGSLHALRHALRTPLFRHVAALTTLVTICGDALADVTNQTLLLRAQFTAKDQALFLMTYGFCGVAVQALMMRPLLSVTGERGAVMFGMCCFVAKLLIFSQAELTRGMAFAAAAVGTGAEVCFPALSALTANSVAPHEQGAAQGGLFAARSLAAGLAPLGWAWMFRECTREVRAPGVPGPQAVFWLAAALCASGAILAAALPRVKSRREEVVNGEAQGLQEPLLGEEETHTL